MISTTSMLQHVLPAQARHDFTSGPCVQGSEHAAFLRRRALWFWLQALQMILYVVILVLCVASPHNFSGDTGLSAAKCHNLPRPSLRVGRTLHSAFCLST